VLLEEVVFHFGLALPRTLVAQDFKEGGRHHLFRTEKEEESLLVSIGAFSDGELQTLHLRQRKSATTAGMKNPSGTSLFTVS
jgi:hypothetical protein